ncbi:hypothetical protein RSAG8_05187, partial [Rhizoctonia solani AG-8 WAC10335]
MNPHLHSLRSDHGDVGGLMIPGAGHALPMLFAAAAVVLAHSLFGSLFGLPAFQQDGNTGL